MGNSANWVEAADTLTKLAKLHRIQMNEHVYFDEPYVGIDEMPSIVDRTRHIARSMLYICAHWLSLVGGCKYYDNRHVNG